MEPKQQTLLDTRLDAAKHTADLAVTDKSNVGVSVNGYMRP